MSDEERDREDEEQEIESEQGEFEDIIPDEPMRIQILQDKIKKGLQVIGKTVDGSGWAFTQLECEGQNISELHHVMLEYPYLRKINLLRNKIEDPTTFTSIKFLTHLNLRDNMINSLSYFSQQGQLEFLEHLDLSHNSLKSLDNIALKNLKTLILTKNEITTAENFQGHPSLQTLQLDKNQFSSLKDLKNMPNLTNLSLQDNPVQEFSGLSDCVQLKNINLKNSQIETIQQENLPDLPYINTIILDDCKKLNSMKIFDAFLKYEGSLATISVNGSLLAEEVGDGLKKEVLMKLPKLKSINEEPVEAEEVEAALQEKKEREEEEARKLAEEEEARRQAEEEAKNKEGEEQEEEE